MILGMIYLASKLVSESIWLIHIHKSEFENPGLLVRNSCGKLFFCLALLQVSTLLKYLGEENYEAALIVISAVVLTVSSYQSFIKAFISPEILSLEAINPSREEIINWQFLYTHPVEKENFSEMEWLQIKEENVDASNDD